MLPLPSMAEQDTLIFANNAVSQDPGEDAEETMPDDPTSPASSHPQRHDRHEARKFDYPRNVEREASAPVQFNGFVEPAEPHRINGRRLTDATRNRDRNVLNAFK